MSSLRAGWRLAQVDRRESSPFVNNQTINGTGGVGNFGLTVNQPTQTGILVGGPITRAGLSIS